jgi:hypothetical protein
MAAKESAAPASSGQPGPRQKVHIRIAYKGSGPPGPNLFARCKRLEERLVEENAGTISGDGTSGDGTVNPVLFTARQGRHARRPIFPVEPAPFPSTSEQRDG